MDGSEKASGARDGVHRLREHFYTNRSQNANEKRAGISGMILAIPTGLKGAETG